MYEETDEPQPDPRPVEVQDWVRELKKIWCNVGLTYGQFAQYGVCDRATAWRYVMGERVPKGPRFLDKLLDILDAMGRPVPPPGARS